MKINESNFVKQLRRRNEKALLYVIDEYGGLLNSIVKKHLYSFPDRQEECMNDILFGIWENINSFDETKNSFKNWSAGVARYKALDYLRKYLKDKEYISFEGIFPETQQTVRDDSYEHLVNQEMSEELELMLECLKPKDRELFLQIFYEEKDLDEISSETGIKKDVLYNRISRGKKRIRKHSAQMKGVL